MEAPYIANSGVGGSFHIGRRPEIKPELARRRAEQDRRMAAEHAYLDAAAKDMRHKFDRPSFSVVGEGSATSQSRFREGWDRIFKTPQDAGPE